MLSGFLRRSYKGALPPRIGLLMSSSFLNPVINSDSIWKSHALYLIAEYFFSKSEKKKKKKFFKKYLKNTNF